MSTTEFRPAYAHLGAEELAKRASALRELMRSCRLCPRNCRADRLADEVGVCGVGAQPVVSSYGPHFGEETPLVGRSGSGTIFLTHCNLKCIFCQNYDISHLGHGRPVSRENVAEIMLTLQQRGCHNINWVTPTHQAPMLVDATHIALGRGLRLPIVYNCGGYESLEALRLLDGIVDIYMPDAKYGDDEAGRQLSGVQDYWTRCREALTEMHRQVGDLQVDADGIAQRGLLVRHLVLPEDMAGTGPIMEFLASLSRNTYINVMAQYRPQYRAHEVPAINRPITSTEFRRAVQAALDAGLSRLDQRRALL
ncbi:MAG: radical SAM protein [Armatimonadota bacterium]|nr:MAG: radical SAM protein [Armatimonadota bacterium]